MTNPNLLQFWRMRRAHRHEPCIIQPMHRQIARSLTALVMGTLARPNLMILEPPRCAKTDLGVRTFIPWSMSYFPDSEYITSSYGADLATDSTVDIRSTLASEWYRSIIDSHWGAHIEMRGERGGGRQDYFVTEEKGSVKGVGRGGSITGFGAGKLREEFGGCIVMDDMLKAQEARSAAARKEAVAYYTGTLKTRRNRQDTPKTPMVLIMQRLHGEDLAGYILREEREEWEVLQVEAHNPEETETCWPGRISLQEMLAMREQNPDDYWSQYMQNPRAGTMTVFRKEWWRYWNDIAVINKFITIKIITADTAFKAESANDWSVFQCWGLCPWGMFLIDQVRKRLEFPELVTTAKEFWTKHSRRTAASVTPATELWVEDKASGQSLVQVLRREGIPARGWTPDESMKANKNKATVAVGIMASPDKVGRANQCTMPLSAHRIFLPDPKMEGYSWVTGFVAEHESFTTDDSHLFDDQVDTFTEACIIWQGRGGGSGAIPPQALAMTVN